MGKKGDTEAFDRHLALLGRYEPMTVPQMAESFSRSVYTARHFAADAVRGGFAVNDASTHTYSLTDFGRHAVERGKRMARAVELLEDMTLSELDAALGALLAIESAR